MPKSCFNWTCLETWHNQSHGVSCIPCGPVQLLCQHHTCTFFSHRKQRRMLQANLSQSRQLWQNLYPWALAPHLHNSLPFLDMFFVPPTTCFCLTMHDFTLVFHVICMTFLCLSFVSHQHLTCTSMPLICMFDCLFANKKNFNCYDPITLALNDPASWWCFSTNCCNNLKSQLHNSDLFISSTLTMNQRLKGAV